MKKEESIQDKYKKFDTKLRFWQAMTFLLCFILVGYLFLIQVVDVKKYKIKAKKQRNAKSFVLRGEILDRNGIKLASDKTSFNVFAHPNDFALTPEELAVTLSPILNIPKSQLIKQLSSPQKIILLKNDADRLTAQKIKKLYLREVSVEKNGRKSASGKASFSVFAHSNDIAHTPKELAEILSPILDIPKSQLVKQLSGSRKIILLKKDIDRLTAQKIRKLYLREISLDKKNERTYPQGTMAAHVLGYYNSDADVAAGVEYSANSLLEDSGQAVNFEKTPNGDIIYDVLTNLEATTTPMKGKTLTLTIDSGIQHVCETELAKVVREKKALRGAVIVMNPKNGEILGYALYPTYDPNNYNKSSQEHIKNWTLTDVFPPGSTFKVFTVAAGLESGNINEFSTINDTGKISIAGWDIKNYDYAKHPNPGNIDLYYLFEHSSNVASAKIAMLIEKQEYYNLLKQFGIGEKTGIDLPSESIGILPNYKNWDKSTHASMGFGYGASVTAIQMASIMAGIANGGMKVTPHIIKYSDEEKTKKVKQTQIMSPQTAATLTKILAGSIERSKSPVNMENYSVAAKTGTSIKPKENEKGYTDNKLYTSILGFFPASNPQAMIYIVVDSASGGEIWGSTVAAPIFKEVALQVAKILNIAPDKYPKTKGKFL